MIHTADSTFRLDANVVDYTTNFVELQRAMASDSISAAKRAPIIGAFPKMFIPFIVIIPGVIAAMIVPELVDLKAGEPAGDVKYNDAILLLMRDLMPNGMLGIAIASLLASFMAGMAANISAFNTVFSYDLTATAGWAGLVSGTVAAVAFLSEDTFGSASLGWLGVKRSTSTSGPVWACSSSALRSSCGLGSAPSSSSTRWSDRLRDLARRRAGLARPVTFGR